MSAASASSGIISLFRIPVFRNVWIASVLSNLGMQVQAVGAAWAMTELTGDASMVALVQTASMLPMMLFAIVAGAIADLYDRRRVALVALFTGFAGAVIFAAVTAASRATPALLLLFCFVIGCGRTLYGPAWQASVREQVPLEVLPAAIALNSISFNVGRSLGPAVGGVILAVAGAFAAFAVNAALFVPILVALLLWQRRPDTPLGPRERLVHAVSLGIRYVLSAPAIRTVLFRVFITGLGNGVVLALLPLVAKRMLGGGALVYSLLLGSFGIGAVLGAFVMTALRHHFTGETIIRSTGVATGAALVVVALSRWSPLTALALLITGICWTISTSMFNVAVQLSAPRWVAGRALSAYQALISGGMAVGSWLWGALTDQAGVAVAFLAAGVFAFASQAVGAWMRIPDVGEFDEDAASGSARKSVVYERQN